MISQSTGSHSYYIVRSFDWSTHVQLIINISICIVFINLLIYCCVQAKEDEKIAAEKAEKAKVEAAEKKKAELEARKESERKKTEYVHT